MIPLLPDIRWFPIFAITNNVMINIWGHFPHSILFPEARFTEIGLLGQKIWKHSALSRNTVTLLYKRVHAVFSATSNQSSKTAEWLKTVYGVRPGFLNLSTIDLWGWIILYCGRDGLCIVGCLPVSLLSTHPLDASNNLPVVTVKAVSTHCQMSPWRGQITPGWDLMC